MALTQSARIPGAAGVGPSWDEEVVPALRKRLESESRTLAKRISAISLGSSSDAPTTGFDSNPGSPTYPSFKASTLNAPYVNGKTPTANRTRTVSNPRQGKVQPQSQTQTQTQMHAPASPQKHPQTPSKSPMTQRARTYSSPHRSDLPSSSGLSARPPMPMLPKPTRIPKRSPVLGVGAGGGPTLNGSGTGAGYGPTPSHGGVTVFGSTQTTTTNGFSGPNANGYTFVNGYTYASGPLATTATTASSSHSTLDLTAVQPSGRTQGYSQAHRLLHEAPPFSSSSASDLEADVSMTSTVSFGSGFGQPSSSSGVRRAEMDMDMASAPRSSMDSEELPYEHWYRGEVSRNGGVGELRVGRRQEMLDIANYGHLVEQRRRGVDGYNTHHSLATRRRRRAGSIGGVTEAIRERGSIYIDDDDFDHRANEVSNVMDEHPLTDLEGETSLSDVDGSLHGHQRQTTIRLGTRGASTDTQRPVDTTPGYAYTPEEEGEGWSSIAGAHEIRSVTPTASNPLGRSLNGQAPPPTRIPGPSSRHSSESRSTVNATSPIRGAASEQGSTKTTFGSTSPTPMASAKSAPMSSGSTSPTPAATGTAKKPVMKKNAGKPPPVTKAKKTPSKAADKGKKGKEDDRRSVAHYPTPDGDEDMADAIPSWTQPVQKQGGWDEVVLPVVARKKGLDGYYEKADGTPQPKKVDTTIAPAPGTFGFDSTKYRRRDWDQGDDSIQMDEFGRDTSFRRPEDDEEEEEEEEEERPVEDERKSVRPNPSAVSLRVGDDGVDPRTLRPTTSPAPFAQYAPPITVVVRPGQGQTHGGEKEKEEDNVQGGCCKCVIM